MPRYRDRREYYRQWRLNGPGGPEDRRRTEVSAKLWHEQDGRCYLCGDQIVLGEGQVDHDHRCCSRKRRFPCDYCIRGLCCPACNYVVGHAYDNPDKLELIARNLRTKLAEMDERLASRPEQLAL